MKKIKTLLFLFLFSLKAIGQNSQSVSISIIPSFGKSFSVNADSLYRLNSGVSFKFETLKFYISQLQLLNEEEIVYSEKNSFHLVDFSEPSTLNLALNLPTQLKYEQLKFTLGIDSLTNVSGAYGGDLDPTKGMYWTWQSGYINFKLEGTCSACPAPKKEFQFHVGGYQSPYSTLQEITLAVSDKDKINVIFDLKQFMEQLDLAKQNHLMSPNKEAVLFSKILAKSFRIK